MVDVSTGRVTARISATVAETAGSPVGRWTARTSRSCARPRPPTTSGSQAPTAATCWITRALPSTDMFFGTPRGFAGAKRIVPDATFKATRCDRRSYDGSRSVLVAAVDGSTVAFVADSNQTTISRPRRTSALVGHGAVTPIPNQSADEVAIAGSRIYWSWTTRGCRPSDCGMASELWTAVSPAFVPKRLVHIESKHPDAPGVTVAATTRSSSTHAAARCSGSECGCEPDPS